MSTTKYMRLMSFGELIRSTLQVSLKTFWPFWIIIILIFFILDRIYFGYLKGGSATSEIVNILMLGFTLLPVFFVGPAMLTISNVILSHPKKTLTSFMTGMSLGTILKIFLYLAPALILALVILGSRDIWPLSYLIFTVSFLLLTPLWVFYPTILLLEKKGVFLSIRRTTTFISGQIKRLFQIQLLLTLLTILLTPLGMLYYVSFYDLPMPLSQVFGQAISVGGYDAYIGALDRLAGGLYYVLPLILGFGITTYVLHYYQVRAAKENFSEELLAQELGYQPIEEMMTA